MFLGIYEIILVLISIYIAVCIGMIAKKLGRNGLLFGILSFLPVVNLAILSILAFTKPE